MRNIESWRTLFLLLWVTGTLILSTPMVLLIIPGQTSEQFSELYIIGSNGFTEDSPTNIDAEITYTINLGLANHQGASAYYLLSGKLRDPSEPLPNSDLSLPSPLPSLFESRVFLSDGEIVEKPLTFSIHNVSLQASSCFMETIAINGFAYNVEKQIPWDQKYLGYFVEFFFELSLFDAETNSFSFQNRWVGIWLNISTSEK